MSDEANELLDKFLRTLQKHKKVRMGIGVLLVAGLLGIAASFLYDALPHTYRLSITGGEMLSSHHFVARVLQRQAADNGVALRLQPVSGSREAVEAVDKGTLDMAFIQDGLDTHHPNVRHVAYIASEPLQLLVRPEIEDITGLRNRLVNLGLRQGGTRAIAREVLNFSGLRDGVDYVESNFSTEELLRMSADELPDAIMVVSFAPADIADFLVKERGYTLLEIPFPESLALRFGWVANSKILAFTYSVAPPVPSHDITTIGINMHLVANKDVEPRAIFNVLESLYGPGLEMGAKIKLDESQLETPSGYELSEGAQLFLDRKNPILTAELMDEIQSMFGVFLSALSGILIAYRWFKGETPPEPAKDDPDFLAWIKEVASIEQEFDSACAASSTQPMSRDFVNTLQRRLSAIKAESLERLQNAQLENAQLPQSLLLEIADARARIGAVASQMEIGTVREAR